MWIDSSLIPWSPPAGASWGAVSAAGSVGLTGCRLLKGDPPERNQPFGINQEPPTTADWPGFRHDGFNSGAIAVDGTPLKERPAVTWRQPVTGVEGSSRHPVVADDLVVFPDWDPAPRPNGVENRVLRAFDAASGKEQWKVTFLSPEENRAHLSQPTVTTDLYIVVGVTDRQTGREESALRAYTMNGKLVWETEGVRGDVI